MKAVILAGGQEYGQCPLARRLPRALWPLLDRPIIEQVLLALRHAGVGHMAISANGCTHKIAQKLAQGLDSSLAVYYSEDIMPRGAAGCLKDCQRWLDEEDFLVVQGSSLLADVDFERLLAEHRRGGAAMTVAATGPVDGAPSLRPAGLYVCDRAVLQYIRDRGYQDIKEQLIPRLIAAGLKVQAVRIRGRVLPVHNEEAYLNATIELLNDPASRQRLTGHLPCAAPGLWIHPTARVSPQARVVGPAYIGAESTLGPDSVIVGPAVVGENCQVEAEAVVHESILWSQSRVGVGALVEQAILASQAMVAAGVEVRGSIVLETNLSVAERESLSGSADLMPVEASPRRRWMRSVLTALRAPLRQALQTQ